MNEKTSDQPWKDDRILVWGIAGASLGAEIAKSLVRSGFKHIIGCDISPLAYGHFSDLYSATYVLNQNSIEQSISKILEKHRPRFVIPGGDMVSRVIQEHEKLFASWECVICGNSKQVVALASDKYEVMKQLETAGFRVPETRLLSSETDLSDIQFPAVFKPRFDSGGSRGVYVVTKQKEFALRRDLILECNTEYIVQEYISEADGEYTIGVLSNLDGQVAGSILMRRTFQNMLSVHERTGDFIVSSGSSQGCFLRNKGLQNCAEAIAHTIGSTGPLNIQARVVDGQLAAFEINPRFSASTFLRALSGLNEIELYIDHLATGNRIAYSEWQEGIALRSFTERFVEMAKVPADVL